MNVLCFADQKSETRTCGFIKWDDEGLTVGSVRAFKERFTDDLQDEYIYSILYMFPASVPAPDARAAGEPSIYRLSCSTFCLTGLDIYTAKICYVSCKCENVLDSVAPVSVLFTVRCCLRIYCNPFFSRSLFGYCSQEHLLLTPFLSLDFQPPPPPPFPPRTPPLKLSPPIGARHPFLRVVFFQRMLKYRVRNLSEQIAILFDVANLTVPRSREQRREVFGT
jgi:hypothetical protein